MQHRNKYKELNITLAFILICLLGLLALSGKALSSYLFAQSTYGEVIDYKVERNRPTHYSAGQITPELHEILIEYRVNNTDYWTIVNSHAYSALELIQNGDKVLVSYDAKQPEQSYVITYLLFSTFASILGPFVLLMILIVTPQWIYHYRQRR